MFKKNILILFFTLCGVPVIRAMDSAKLSPSAQGKGAGSALGRNFLSPNAYCGAIHFALRAPVAKVPKTIPTLKALATQTAINHFVEYDPQSLAQLPITLLSDILLDSSFGYDPVSYQEDGNRATAQDYALTKRFNDSNKDASHQTDSGISPINAQMNVPLKKLPMLTELATQKLIAQPEYAIKKMVEHSEYYTNQQRAQLPIELLRPVLFKRALKILGLVPCAQIDMRYHGFANYDQTKYIGLTHGFVMCQAGDSTLQIRNEDCNVIALCKGHTDEINSIIALKDNVVATCSDDKTIRLWDTEGNLLGMCKDTAKVRGISVKDGKLVSISQDQLEREWDLGLVNCFDAIDYKKALEMNDFLDQLSEQIRQGKTLETEECWQKIKEITEDKIVPSSKIKTIGVIVAGVATVAVVSGIVYHLLSKPKKTSDATSISDAGNLEEQDVTE